MKYNDNGEWKDIQVKVANAIQNEYGESNNDGYSQNYLNEHTINVGVNDTDFRVNFVKGKNLSDGASQNVYIDSSVGTCTIISGNTGLYIFVNGGKYTISTTDTQTIYRVGLTTSRPSATQQTLYRGVKKDNTSDSITIDTTGYNFLCLTCTDLSKIQIEKGNSATSFEAIITPSINVDNEEIYNQQYCNSSINSDATITSGSSTYSMQQLLLDKISAYGNFSLSSNSIVVGEGINQILVSLNMNIFNATDNHFYNPSIRLYRNGTRIDQVNCPRYMRNIQGSYSISPYIFDVQENDVIKCEIQIGSANETFKVSKDGTNLFIQKLK